MTVLLKLVEFGGARILEGVAGASLLAGGDAGERVVEACANQQASGVLLYRANLPVGFFDLSTGVAGEMLQRLRIYGIRFGLVAGAEELPAGRFREMSGEENRGRDFGVFEDRDAALAWLSQSA